jgi:hypothetical protein
MRHVPRPCRLKGVTRYLLILIRHGRLSQKLMDLCISFDFVATLVDEIDAKSMQYQTPKDKVGESSLGTDLSGPFIDQLARDTVDCLCSGLFGST